MTANRSTLSRRGLWQAGGAIGVGLALSRQNALADDETACVKPADTDWPWWRGPSYNGCAVGDIPPLKWTETKNVVWKVAVPGQGHATPIIWGSRIFLATADETKETQSLVCSDRRTGRILWERKVYAGGLMPKHKKNTHASATPACDGERVFVLFYRHQAIFATAIDFSGRTLWQKKVVDYKERYGYGSSPTIYGRSLVIAADSRAAGSLIALDRATGKELWRTERPKLPSYGPPVVATIQGRHQIVVQGNQVAGYDPRTGDELWHCQAPARATACTLCFDGRRVYSTGGYPERRLYCIAADGTGDVTGSHIKWKKDRKSSTAYVPSPLLAVGRLFIVSDGGVATCFRAEDGHQHWTKRLGGAVSASPILIGDYLIAPNEAGKTFVFKASDQYQLVAQNTLADGIMVSPVVCGGRLYLRTTAQLYCIGS